MLFRAVKGTACGTWNIKHTTLGTAGGKHSYHYAVKVNTALKYSSQFLSRLHRLVLNKTRE